MKLLIAGGGTGGHVFPALAVTKEWLGRDEGREVVVVGTKHGLEATRVPAAGVPLETLRVAGLKGVDAARLLRNAALLPAALLDSAAVLRRHRFAAALGVGGYASGPMMLVAALAGVPSVIFEPNVLPGFTNRVLARLATRIAAGSEETAECFGRKAVVTGCPVRPEFFQAPQREHRPPFHLLVTGGSQGAQAINRAFIEAVGQFAAQKNQLFIVHQTGERDYNAVRVAYAERHLSAEVVPFLENMAERFAWADLIVCRSGAITVAEVAAAGRAAIFIPFGAATDSHQLGNAQAMAEAGAARLIREEELAAGRLTGEIFSLLAQPEKLGEMERRARERARPRAALDIVELLEGIARR